MNEQKRKDYLIAKKEAYNWLIWSGIIYALAVIGTIFLAIYDISTFGRFLSIVNYIMIPTVLIFSLPNFRKATRLELENPELKKLKVSQAEVPTSAILKRFGILLAVFMTIIILFFRFYTSGLEENKKRETYEIINNISK